MTIVNDVTDLAIEAGVAVLTIDSPPVNALSVPVRRGLIAGMEQAIGDDAVSAIVIRCAGRTFFAGFDIAELDSGLQEPDLNAVLDRIERSAKPVIAALHGTALGGGFELALACDYRVAAASAKVGLPEVNLGLLPGAGGTQRLPRIVGVEAALDMIVFGKPVTGAAALELGLVDLLVEDATALRDAAVDFAEAIVRDGRTLVKVRDREDRLAAARADPAIFDAFRREHAPALRGPKAPEHIIRAIEAAVTLPFEAGLRREAELFAELFASVESAAQRYIFFAQRAAAKVPGISPETPVRAVNRIAVVGAGATGGGIAMTFLDIGVPVTLVEQAADALEHGVEAIRRQYANRVRAGGLPAGSVERRTALLTPTLDLAALGGSDLVIEAVSEKVERTRRMFVRLDEVAKPGAILASSTSFLDLDALAAITARPQDVIGLHFPAPAAATRLLEVVRGERTDPGVVATAMHLARRIDRIAVLSRVCEGLIADRAIAAWSEPADRLLREGQAPGEIDRVITAFGFATGPFAEVDRLGLDGADRSIKNGAAPRPHADREIIERLLYPVVNEAAKIVEEGVALRASDVDVALTAGHGWPIHTGGPTFWADGIGLAHVVARLDMLRLHLGDAYQPCELLRRVASEGGRLHLV